MNEWSHLPNAAHIDRILADLKANLDRWAAANFAAYSVAYDAACDAGTTAAYSVAYAAARNAAEDAACDAGTTAALAAILALIAYDDCVYLLDEKPEDVHMFALLGQPAAILLYPACLAFAEEKRQYNDR